MQVYTSYMIYWLQPVNVFFECLYLAALHRNDLRLARDATAAAPRAAPVATSLSTIPFSVLNICRHSSLRNIERANKQTFAVL